MADAKNNQKKQYLSLNNFITVHSDSFEICGIPAGKQFFLTEWIIKCPFTQQNACFDCVYMCISLQLWMHEFH